MFLIDIFDRSCCPAEARLHKSDPSKSTKCSLVFVQVYQLNISFDTFFVKYGGNNHVPIVVEGFAAHIPTPQTSFLNLVNQEVLVLPSSRDLFSYIVIIVFLGSQDAQ